MTSKTTKCPYCRRGYQQPAAYEKHLHTMHLDIVLSLNAIADAASSTARPTFVRDQLENMTDSDYEYDPGLEIADIHTTSSEIDDMHNDSDTEDISHPPVRAPPLDQQTIPGAGRPLGEVAWLYRAQQGHNQ